MAPLRIVCLAAETPEILYRLGKLDCVVGISAYTTQPQEALKIPKVSGFKYGSIERILSMQPDLVILTSGVQKDLANQLAEEGITILHFNPHHFDELFASIRLLGNVVAEPENAELLCMKIQNEVEWIRTQAQSLAYHPTVYFEEWMDPLICGTGWVSDLIEIAGGRDIFRERSVHGRKAADRIVQPDDILQASPDIMLASWCGKPFNHDEVQTREGFQMIPQICEIKSTVLQFGPMLLDSLREIHTIIRTYVSNR